MLHLLVKKNFVWFLVWKKGYKTTLVFHEYIYALVRTTDTNLPVIYATTFSLPGLVVKVSALGAGGWRFDSH